MFLPEWFNLMQTVGAILQRQIGARRPNCASQIMIFNTREPLVRERKKAYNKTIR